MTVKDGDAETLFWNSGEKNPEPGTPRGGRATSFMLACPGHVFQSTTNHELAVLWLYLD